jgi:hypothetical protein
MTPSVSFVGTVGCGYLPSCRGGKHAQQRLEIDLTLDRVQLWGPQESTQPHGVPTNRAASFRLTREREDTAGMTKSNPSSRPLGFLGHISRCRRLARPRLSCVDRLRMLELADEPGERVVDDRVEAA